MSVAINGTDGITFNDGSLQPSAPVGKNLIINGNMDIDQRNAGAAFTITTDNQYGLDRWVGRTFGGAGKFSMQKVADAPSGFAYSNKITVTTTATSGVGGYGLEQRIEGSNLTMLNWGTANAKPLTASFWIKSSVVGTYSCALRTSTSSVSGISHCVNTFTISVANTWEYKTISFPANTAYDTVTNDITGIFFDINFGAQTAKSTSTLNTWALGNFLYATGQTDVMPTSGATINITGVQVETGTTATPFENLQYGQQLSICQRYYQQYGSSGATAIADGMWFTTTQILGSLLFPIIMRAAPTMTTTGTGWIKAYRASGTSTATGSGFFDVITNHSARFNMSGWDVAGTAGQATYLQLNSGKYIFISAEL